MPDIDKLTGFVTQKFFLERLEEEVLRTKRYKAQLSLLMAKPDQEFFEKDPYAKTTLHYTLMKQLGVIFRKILRDVDMMGRYEGDSIVVMLPETGEEGAKLAAERLRKAVETHEFTGDDKKPTFRAAISIGLASFFKHAKTSNELVVGAEKGLRLAISEGGNRVVLCPITLEEIS